MKATNCTLGLSIMAVVGALLACGGTQEAPVAPSAPCPDLGAMGVEPLAPEAVRASPCDCPAGPAAASDASPS